MHTDTGPEFSIESKRDVKSLILSYNRIWRTNTSSKGKACTVICEKGREVEWRMFEGKPGTRIIFSKPEFLFRIYQKRSSVKIDFSPLDLPPTFARWVDLIGGKSRENQVPQLQFFRNYCLQKKHEHTKKSSENPRVSTTRFSARIRNLADPVGAKFEWQLDIRRKTRYNKYIFLKP